MVPDAGQIQTTEIWILTRDRARAYTRLHGEEVLCFLEVVGDCLGGGRSVACPPPRRSFQLRRCARGDFNREHFAQELRRRRRSNSSADRVSPRSACAIDSSNSASNSAGTTKVSSVSRDRIVTTVPSGKDSPSTTIFPPTTVPVVSCMWEILHRDCCDGNALRPRRMGIDRSRSPGQPEPTASGSARSAPAAPDTGHRSPRTRPRRAACPAAGG